MELRTRLTSEQDRLAAALFAAALLHGLVILGVRFAAPPATDTALPTLEVLLVPAGPDEDANTEASYIAERDQHGTGTGRDDVRSSMPEARPALAPDPGDTEQDGTAPDAAMDAVDGASVLSAREANARRALAGSEEAMASAASRTLAVQPLPQVGINAAAAEPDVVLRGDAAEDGRLLADTRESQIAGYLDGWKRRIERIGTLNFPNEARRQALSGNPVVEVAIAADGRLTEVVVRRSSGFRELDQAAVNIVRLASPFDPFPTSMRARYPVLRFAYEWRFLNGRLGGSAVRAAEP